MVLCTICSLSTHTADIYDGCIYETSDQDSLALPHALYFFCARDGAELYGLSVRVHTNQYDSLRLRMARLQA